MSEPVYPQSNELRGGKEKYHVKGDCSECGNYSEKMVKGKCTTCYSKVKGAEKQKRKKNFPF